MYCPIILSCTSNTNTTRILKLQKKALRVMTKSPYAAHTLELFTSHNILPYDLLLKQAKLHFMHSYVYGYANKSFENTWTTNNQLNPLYDLRNNNDFIIPMPRIELFKKTPLYSLPLAWNNAGNIKLQHNKVTFKWGLREELFEELNLSNTNN